MLYTWAGPEIAVATTKAYSTQLVVLDMLGLYFAEVLGTIEAEEYTAVIRELECLPDKVGKRPWKRQESDPVLCFPIFQS